GHCAPERIPLSLVAGAVADEMARQQAVAALQEVSLVKNDPFEEGLEAITVHRLVQVVARTRAEAQGTSGRAMTALLERLETLYPQDGYSNTDSWSHCAVLTPHLLAVCETETADSVADIQRAGLLSHAASYFRGRAAYAAALPLFERALTLSERGRGPE